MTHFNRWAAAALAMAVSTPIATAKSVDKATAWGAATAATGFGAVVEAAKGHPDKAILYGAGAVLSYTQYDKARRERDDEPYAYDRAAYDDRDPYGYDNGPSWRRDNMPAYTRYTSRTREVSGVVTSTAGAFDRDIHVRLDNGEIRNIDVPRGITVRRYGRSISVHELRSGDLVRIRIDRYRSDGDLRASRIDAYDSFSRADRRDDPYYPDARYNTTLSGRVSSIDSRAGILRLDADGRILSVYTDRADIRDGRGRLDLRDLQSGDRVTVEGRRTGNRIDADRVTVR